MLFFHELFFSFYTLTWISYDFLTPLVRSNFHRFEVISAKPQGFLFQGGQWSFRDIIVGIPVGRLTKNVILPVILLVGILEIVSWSSILSIIHPPKQTWNLKMDPWKRRFLLETIISRFHVNFLGCIHQKLRKSFVHEVSIEVPLRKSEHHPPWKKPVEPKFFKPSPRHPWLIRQVQGQGPMSAREVRAVPSDFITSITFGMEAPNLRLASCGIKSGLSNLKKKWSRCEERTKIRDTYYTSEN